MKKNVNKPTISWIVKCTGYKGLIWLIIKFLMMHFYFLIDWFVMQTAVNIDTNNKKLLDIGAGETPYKKYFSRLKYFSQDIHQNSHHSIDFVSNLNQGLTGITDSNFDYILCTQVLEHIQFPENAFKEFHRILKPEGKLFLTTNFIYQMHMIPNDYFRFTEYGLRHLGESNGFKIVDLRPQGGIFQILSYIVTTLPVRILVLEKSNFYLLYLVFFSPIIILINLIAVILDVLDKQKLLTINYSVVYEKI